MRRLLVNLRSAAGMPIWLFATRASWVAVQIVVVYWFAQKGSPFFYQGF